MNAWWYQAPIWQRFLLLGLGIVMLLLAMYIGVWRSLEQSIELANQDIRGLTRQTQEAIQKIGRMNELKGEITLLRQKLSPQVQRLSAELEPQSIRRDVVDIGKRAGVTVRLWKPKRSVMGVEYSDTSLDILVRVEGSFYSTVIFLDELLQLSWIETIDNLVLTRKQHSTSSVTILTEFTITGLSPKGLEQVQEM